MCQAGRGLCRLGAEAHELGRQRPVCIGAEAHELPRGKKPRINRAVVLKSGQSHRGEGRE